MALEPVEPPVAELVAQVVQVAAPVEVLYVFAEHAVKAPPFGPVYPAIATHAVTAVEPVAPPVVE